MPKFRKIETRLDRVEDQLREIFKLVNSPSKETTLMQLRVSALKRISAGVELIDRLLETIETEYVTIEDPAPSKSVVFLNKQQEQEHNDELNDIAGQLREIRLVLVTSENLQNVGTERDAI